MDPQSTTSQDLVALSRKEVSVMKEKWPKDLKILTKEQLQKFFERISAFEKELENRMNILRTEKRARESEELYKILNEVFDARIMIEDVISPPTIEEEQDKGGFLPLFTNTSLPVKHQPPSFDKAVNFSLPNNAKEKAIPIQEMESLSIKEPIVKSAVRNQTFIEFRKQWLAMLLQDQAPTSESEPSFAFRVVSNGVNKGWQALPPLPSGFLENYRGDTPLPPSYNSFRLFSIFFELNRVGYVSVVHLYNWKRKVIGAYRSLLIRPSRADVRAIRTRSEQLFPIFADHLTQSNDPIIHMDFFATPEDKIPLMVWTFSEETGVMRAILQRETFISKTLNTNGDDFFD